MRLSWDRRGSLKVQTVQNSPLWPPAPCSSGLQPACKLSLEARADPEVIHRLVLDQFPTAQRLACHRATCGSRSSAAQTSTHRHTQGLGSGTRSELWCFMVLCLRWRKLGGLSGEAGWALLVFTPSEMYVPRKMSKLCCRRGLSVWERRHLCAKQQP